MHGLATARPHHHQKQAGMIGLAADPLKTAQTLGRALSLMAGLEGMQGEELPDLPSDLNLAYNPCLKTVDPLESFQLRRLGLLQQQQPADDSRSGSANDENGEEGCLTVRGPKQAREDQGLWSRD